ncbi:DMT family transporter [Azospirillum halopraeferens]|uniref:DMT family transporter n=1 Tax=Azospirillum halopraeferens TaxID=34010 RepID=UPI0003F50B41|nr:DMT family transporter [Azospirillum halopraeferens]
MPDTTAASLPPSDAAPRPLEGPLLLASLALFWGTNWPAMKLALTGMDPWTFRALCLAAGGGGLLLAVRMTGRSLRIPEGDRWPLLVVSLFNVTGWQICSAVGLTFMEAGRASIIAFTMPVWASLLGVLLLKERLTAARLAGLGLGLAALALLVAPALDKLGAAPWGVVFMLGAAVSWAAGTVGLKLHRWSLDTVQLSGWQLTLGGLPVVAGMLAFGEPARLADAPWDSLAAALYAMLIPMIYCHWAWFRVVALFPANVAALGTLAIPVVGVFSSGLLLGERLGIAELAALGLVVAALGLVLLAPGRRRAAR